MSSNTDSQRRLALQLAIQLPENVEDAERVLALAGELLHGFMVEPSQARRRALKLGWNVAPPVAGAPSPARHTFAWSTLWALCSLVVATPLGAVLDYGFGAGAGMVFAVAVVAMALVFGTVPALIVGALCALMRNLLLIPPALEFNRPTAFEIMTWLGYVALALLVPYIADRRERIRIVAIPAAAGNVVALRDKISA